MRSSQYPAPPMRRIRVYAFDPQASMSPESAGVNVATIKLPWEQSWEEPLSPGPVNDYLEVVDIDPVSGAFYDPVDLDHPHLLAQDGLAPSEGNPQFHQQMVFAVAMKTIRVFERALGRRVLWAPRYVSAPVDEHDRALYKPVHKLRIYPHALREPNAYYSRDKKALLFGYFRTSTQEAGASWVFTCLSHDIIVHEVTHAILDGLHRRFAEATSVDSLAFHEAFADIVALFSHFTVEEAVRAQISKNGGRLNDRSLLSGLARQFGAATGRDGALREAIDDGGSAPTTLSEDMTEPHDRGAVLVAAVFDAFLAIYGKRTADLMRIAGVKPGSGPVHDLHPDLVNRLTREASKSAEHVMRMCIRALDYLPPVDVRFGDFLRAIVTADYDLVPDDTLGYRLAVIEGFRRRGIVPDGCLSLATDSLLWEQPPHEISVNSLKGLDLQPRFERGKVVKAADTNAYKVWRWMMQRGTKAEDRQWQEVCGVVFRRHLQSKDDRETILSKPGSPNGEYPGVEVHSVRTTRRTGPDGQDLRQLIVEVAQQRRGFYDEAEQREQDASGNRPKAGDFRFRGGATLVFDLREGHLRYAIRKRISDDHRLEGQRRFLLESRFGDASHAFGVRETLKNSLGAEPFAMVHRGE